MLADMARERGTFFVRPALGKTYTSKRAIRADARKACLREIGTDMEGAVKESFAAMPRKPDSKANLISAYKKVREGYKPAPLQTGADSYENSDQKILPALHVDWHEATRLR